MSPSSKSADDPLSNVLDVLGARVTRLTRLEAAGRWALSFPVIDRLKFVALLRGTAWMVRPGHAPSPMRAGDVCLIGRTDYGIASDPTLPPRDGQQYFGDAGADAVRLGGDEVVSVGGTVTFDGDAARFLLNMLPDFMVVPGDAPGSDVVSTLLHLLSVEVARPGLGHGIVCTRLADVLLVEAIRAHAAQVGPAATGWLGALNDPRIGRALAAFHADLAQPWTVAGLAGVAGMSRAAFSADFTRRLGQPPMAYLRAWRLSVAHAALSRGTAPVADVAVSVGYASQSAFGQAFRRAYGTAPRRGTRE